MDKAKVVIVGGGISGLFCALRLVESGVENITILESSDRLGGRVKTEEAEGGVLEMGAQWIHGRGSNPVWNFASKNKLNMSKQLMGDGDGEFLFPSGQPVNPTILDNTKDFLDSVHEEMDSFVRGSHTDSAPHSVGFFFEKRFQQFLDDERDQENRKLMSAIYSWYMKWERVDTGVDDLTKQSVLSWSDYIEYDREGREDDPILENGYHTLVRFLYEKIKDSVDISYNSRVKNVSFSSSPLTVHTQVNSYNADYVVITISLGVLKAEYETLFSPRLPFEKEVAIKQLGFGVMDKIFLTFEQPFWNKENGGIQLVWPADEEEQVEICEKNNLNNWVRNIPGFDVVCGQENMLCGWLYGDTAAKVESLPETEVLLQCWRLLQVFTGSRLTHPTSCRVTHWATHPDFRGSYSYTSPDCEERGIGPWSLAQPLITEGCPRLLFSGEATSTGGYGTVHGAMESGEREAARILHTLIK